MARYLTLRVTLVWTDVWRLLVIPAKASFHQLHAAIQDAFGWQDGHLYLFTHRDSDDLIARRASDWYDDDVSIPDSAKVRVGDVLGRGKRGVCWYLYDLGDDWLHMIQVRGDDVHNARFGRLLLDGELSGPPEDCGGVPGYYRMMEVVQTGEDPWGSLRDARDWLGGWRPDGFVLGEAKARFDRGAAGADAPVWGARPVIEPSVALPEGVDPRLREVSAALVEVMFSRGWSYDEIALAEKIWCGFVLHAAPKPRKPAIYAAAVEYCLARGLGEEVAQAELAQAYGTSAVSVSKTWRPIWDAMELVAPPKPPPLW